MKGLRLRDAKNGEQSELAVKGMFLGIGHEPNTKMLEGEIDLDEEGYVKTANNVFTTKNGAIVQGVYACGDVQDRRYRQAITAAGSGCMAALEAEKYLGGGAATGGLSGDGCAMTALRENLERLEEAITQACRAAGRARGEVELMAVSKTFSGGGDCRGCALGLTLFGENRVQEFNAKVLHAAETGTWAVREALRFHLIGHLQSNKAAKAAELFDGVDSLESVRLAERLNEAAGKFGKRLPVLIEVKLSPEAAKTGVEPESDEAARLLELLPDLEHLEARGLMTIAPWGAAEDVTRACFRSLRVWRDRWAAAHPRLSLDVLSMGMSGDFALAIARGRDAHSRRHGAVRRAQAADGAAKPGIGARLMLRARADGVTLAVRAQPGAKKTAIAGIYGEGAAAQLKIAVQAPPLEGPRE